MAAKSHPDEDLKKRHELLANEFQAVNRKLTSKNDALIILSRELSECQKERDSYKLMADQLRSKYQSLKRQLNRQSSQVESYVSMQGDITAELDINSLKQRLCDAEADVKLLREKLVRQRLGNDEQQFLQRKYFCAEDKMELINELELSRNQFKQLEQDMKQLLDEKEEIVTERDAYKQKYNRLNEELNYIMRGDDRHVIDIDSQILENRFLQQKVKHLEEENATINVSLAKYKSMLEKKKYVGILKSTAHQVVEGIVVSQQHIKNMLSNSSSSQAPTYQVVEELKGLALTLLESINDKNLALNHQRKSNKLLASRISDLEQKINDLETKGDVMSYKEKISVLVELSSQKNRLLSQSLSHGSISKEDDDPFIAPSVDTPTDLVLPNGSTHSEVDLCNLSLVGSCEGSTHPIPPELSEGSTTCSLSDSEKPLMPFL